MISEESCDTEDWRNDAETSFTNFLFGGVYIIFVALHLPNKLFVVVVVVKNIG